MVWISTTFSWILSYLRQLLSASGEQGKQIAQMLEYQVAQGKQIADILRFVTPAPGVSAVGDVFARNAQGEIVPQSYEGEYCMSKITDTARFTGRKLSGEPARRAGSDVSITAEGTALYTTTALDAKGNPTAWPEGGTVTNPVVTDPSTVPGGPYWAVSENTADTTGASLIGTPENVSPAPAGALPDVGVGLSATITFPGIPPFSINYPLIDVVVGPANTAVGQVNGQ